MSVAVKSLHRINVNLVNTVFVIITGIFTFAVIYRFMSEAPTFKGIMDIVFIGVNLALWGYKFLDSWFDSHLFNIRQHVYKHRMQRSFDSRFRRNELRSLQ